MSLSYKYVGNERRLIAGDIFEEGTIVIRRICDGMPNGIKCSYETINSSSGFWNRKNKHLCENCIKLGESFNNAKTEKEKFIEQKLSQGLSEAEAFALYNIFGKERKKHYFKPETLENRRKAIRIANDLLRDRLALNRSDAMTKAYKIIKEGK